MAVRSVVVVGALAFSGGGSPASAASEEAVLGLASKLMKTAFPVSFFTLAMLGFKPAT